MIFKILFVTVAVLATVNLNNAAPNPNLCPDDPRCQEPFPGRVVRSPKPQCDLNDPTRVDRRCKEGLVRVARSPQCDPTDPRCEEPYPPGARAARSPKPQCDPTDPRCEDKYPPGGLVRVARSPQCTKDPSCQDPFPNGKTPLNRVARSKFPCDPTDPSCEDKYPPGGLVRVARSPQYSGIPNWHDPFISDKTPSDKVFKIKIKL